MSLSKTCIHLSWILKGTQRQIPIRQEFSTRVLHRHPRGLRLSPSTSYSKHHQYQQQLSVAILPQTLPQVRLLTSGNSNMDSPRVESLWKTFLRTVDNFPKNRALEDGPYSFTYEELHKNVQAFTALMDIGYTQSPFIVSLLPAGARYIVSSLSTLSLGKTVVVIHDTYTNAQVENCLKALNYPPVVTTEVKWDSLETVFGRAYPNLYFIPETLEPTYTNFSEGGSKYGGSSRIYEEVYESKSIIVPPTEDVTPADSGSPLDAIRLHDEDLQDVAYCLFTSGSTGTPKAVLIRGSSIINGIEHLVATDEATFTSSSLRGLMGVTISFVPSLSDIWTIFISGGTLVVPPMALKLDIDRYRTWITAQRITTATFATPMMEALLSKDADKLTSLRWVTFGGARVNPGRINMKNVHFNAYNNYGSTEIFLGVMCLIPKGSENVTMSVGKPIRNVKVYIVDEEGHEVVTPDLRGEIHVAGAGLMRGYYGQPDLTARALAPNRFDPDMSPLFNTGDWGYWSPEGELYVTGRKDDQVKIHGMRLELGEIESALCTYPGIRQAVAVVRDVEEDANKHIRVFCTLEDEQSEPKPEKLNEFLVQRLQRHAIPASISFLDELPKTPSGKINRMQLKDWPVETSDSSRSDPSNGVYDYPVSDWVQTVRAVWAEVLKLPTEEIGTKDNFFYLGGNSIMTFAVLEKLSTIEPKLKYASPFLLFSVPVLQDYAQALCPGGNFGGGDAPAVNTTNFKAEILLPSDFPQGAGKSAIMITGATGFLGSLLLMDVLKAYDDSEVFVIVRAKDDDQARKRLVDILHSSGLFNHMVDFHKRVRCLAGDLTRVKFGLDRNVYDSLRDKVRIVFHSAADVSFMKTYDQLRDTTVTMTKNTLRFVMEGSPKEFHFMSTVGVMDGIEDYFTSIYEVEEDRIPAEVNPTKMVNAYFQSKWVSEQLVWACVERGLIASIYRIGQVGAHPETNVVNRSDAIAGFVVTCKKMKRFPWATLRLPFVDGDITETIVALSRIPPAQNESWARVFHLVGKEVGFRDLFDTMKEVRAIPLADWEVEFHKAVAPAPKTEDEINAWLFLQMFKKAEEQVATNEKSLMKNISFQTTETVKVAGNKFQKVNAALYAELLCNETDEST